MKKVFLFVLILSSTFVSPSQAMEAPAPAMPSTSQFIKIVKGGDIARINRFLEENSINESNINSFIGPHGDSVLVYAPTPEVQEFLQARGMNPELKNYKGISASMTIRIKNQFLLRPVAPAGGDAGSEIGAN